jgi:deoxycytidylate deaminase
VFKKSTLYVVRTDVNGNYRNSAPCKNCHSIINELGIKRIIFSGDEDEFTIVKTSDYNTEHISNGNRYLNMTDEEKRERRKKRKPTIQTKTNNTVQ